MLEDRERLNSKRGFPVERGGLPGVIPGVYRGVFVGFHPLRGVPYRGQGFGTFGFVSSW